MAELDAMLRMLYGSPEADPDLLRFFAINGDGDEDCLAFDEFAQVGRSLPVSNRVTAGVSIWGCIFLAQKRFITNRAPQLRSFTKYIGIRCVIYI